jgi:VWFA-related protein
MPHLANRPAVLIAFAASLFAASASPPSAEDPPPPARPEIALQEEVQVRRVLLDVRVTDRDGRAILGLGPGDFRVRVDGREVPVEAVDWVEPAADPEQSRPASVVSVEREPDSPASRSLGRMVLLLFQRSLHPSRIVGLMKLVPQAEAILERLDPDDRVAILTFGSHLKLYTDFTHDHERIRRILRTSIIQYDDPPDDPVADLDLLASRLDPRTGKDAASLEAGLRLIGEALEPLPGPKTLILLGWGMGQWVPSLGIVMRPDYEPALAALGRSRTTVFTLDITQADYHTLEHPLISLARATGGYYEKTHLFPRLVLERVAEAIRGHYVLAFENPSVWQGRHHVSVRLVGKEGTVYHRDYFHD